MKEFFHKLLSKCHCAAAAYQQFVVQFHVLTYLKYLHQRNFNVDARDTIIIAAFTLNHIHVIRHPKTLTKLFVSISPSYCKLIEGVQRRLISVAQRQSKDTTRKTPAERHTEQRAMRLSLWFRSLVYPAALCNNIGH